MVKSRLMEDSDSYTLMLRDELEELEDWFVAEEVFDEEEVVDIEDG